MTRMLIEKSGAATKSLGKGIFEAKLIQSGWGSSGYYSEALLEEFGPSTFKKGTPSFANHPTEDEYKNGRDVTKIWAKLESDAEYREGALYAKVKVRPEYVDFIEEYKDTIGMSIFAQGASADGEAEGREGKIVESFDTGFPYTSVDFVVAAGAGGKVESLLESFKIREALDSDRREQLRNLVLDAHNAENTYVWVRDYDDAGRVVYFDVEGPEGFSIYRQTYTVDSDIATGLEGEREEVRAATTYVPVGEPSTKENAMNEEDRKALAADIAAAVKEALAAKAPEVDESKAPTAAEVAEAVTAADLPAAARARVFEALKKDPEADVAAVIEAEKSYAESLLTEHEGAEQVAGRVREAATTDTEFKSPWSR